MNSHLGQCGEEERRHLVPPPNLIGQYTITLHHPVLLAKPKSSPQLTPQGCPDDVLLRVNGVTWKRGEKVQKGGMAPEGLNLVISAHIAHDLGTLIHQTQRTLESHSKTVTTASSRALQSQNIVHCFVFEKEDE